MPLIHFELSDVLSVVIMCLFFRLSCVVNTVVKRILLACNFLYETCEPEWFKKMSDESDYYAVLGIPKNATDTAIKKAYVLAEFCQLLKKIVM